MTLPHKGKMIWCSYFRSFIKLTNFSRCKKFHQKLNFVSTPWKIIIPLAHHPPYHPPNTPLPTTPPTLSTTKHTTTHPTNTNSTTLTPSHHQPHLPHHPPTRPLTSTQCNPPHPPIQPPPFIKSAIFPDVDISSKNGILLVPLEKL